MADADSAANLTSQLTGGLAGGDINLMWSAIEERLEALESAVEEKTHDIGGVDAKLTQLVSLMPKELGEDEDMASFIKATARNACEG